MGKISLRIVKVLMMKSVTISTTIAHDSHNIVFCGTNDEDMILACNKLKEIGGLMTIIITSYIINDLKNIQ